MNFNLDTYLRDNLNADSLLLFDDCFINDDTLLDYVAQDWRYLIPETIYEAKKLLKKTVTADNIVLKKQWVFEKELSVVEHIADKNIEENNDAISCSGYGHEGSLYYKICQYGYDNSIEVEISESEYESAIESLDLLPDNARDVAISYEPYKLIAELANEAFYERHNNDGATEIINEVEVFLLSALELAVKADKEQHGNNSNLCQKAHLATQAMKCLCKAKEMIADSELLNAHISHEKMIKTALTAELMHELTESIKAEAMSEARKSIKAEKSEHGKMMSRARVNKRNAAYELLSEEWLRRYKNERWSSAEAGAEALSKFMRDNGFAYKHRWIADTIRATAKAHNIQLR
jgi:hypothetical protein